jgi:hypothetical protein
MAIGRPSVAALAIGGAAAAMFIAHESLLVLVGRRGVRLRHAHYREAVVWLAASGSLALVFGATSVLLVESVTRWTLGVPLVCGMIASIYVARAEERSTLGEISVAAALVSVSFPVAIAASASTITALTCALAFGAAFIAATMGVRAVIAPAHRSRRLTRSFAIVVTVLILSGVALLASEGIILSVAVWAALPVSAVAIVLAAVAPPPRYLRQIGWTLVGASALTSVILVAAMR